MQAKARRSVMLPPVLHVCQPAHACEVNPGLLNMSCTCVQVSEGWVPSDAAVGAVPHAPPHPPVSLPPLLQ